MEIRTKRGRARRLALSAALFAASAAVVGVVPALTTPATAWADGPAPCTAGPPPQPFHGFCATYDGANTWFGSYGSGFPSALGWGFCAGRAAGGGDYPTTSYGYVPTGAPAGSGGDDAALGFAFSQGQAAGWWGGSLGQFSADQAAAAGKILYDAVVWGEPVPSMDPGVLAAFDDFDNWYDQALGLTGTPQLDVGLVGSGTTFDGTATDDIHLQFPGTGHPLVGLGVLLSITNGTFDTPTGPTFLGASTDSNGNILVPVFAQSTGPVTVTVQSDTEVGLPGMDFFTPTNGDLSAQVLAAFAAPTNLQASQSLQSTGTPAPETGTLSIQKAGDDTAYYSVAGAVFDIEQASNVVAQLTTDASGATPMTSPLPVGAYTVAEASAPAGYGVAPAQSATVVANTNSVVSFTGTSEDHIIPANVSITKADAETGAPLGGAVFDLRYDAADNGTYSQDLGNCTTEASGVCATVQNDAQRLLLPGNYEITEIKAPPGYFLDPANAVQTIDLTPGESGSVHFADLALGSLEVNKTGDDQSYESVTGAVFSVEGPAPSTATLGTLTVGPSGSSNVLAGLTPGTYTLSETAPPGGYQAAAPMQVAVAGGHTTTAVDVLDHVTPATLTLEKQDAETHAPLAGAVFDLRYDATNSGTYSDDVGHCTTDASGACAPAGNDGATSLLPGNYEVTEVNAPAGYSGGGSTQDVTLAPGQVGTATFDDALLVSAQFQKSATGNVNQAAAIFAGAVINVLAASPQGAVVATCTTGATGVCTTPAVLQSGATYCWSEPTAPVGLAAGASGCFRADNAQATQPIGVVDQGEYVALAAKKVDAASPTTTIAGANFDLYREDGGSGPNTPAAPSDAATRAGATWVDRATSDANGTATFAMQLPGYAYCVVEQSAPANYVTNGTAGCTPVLAGSTAAPAVPTVVTVADTEATVTLAAHKFNSTAPDTGIPGATYDLYVEGAGPPSGPPTPSPSGVGGQPGDTWWSRGTTDANGMLVFSVPAGYAWCLHEVAAPPDYSLDPALHCSAVLTSDSPATTTIALPETPATVFLTAHKFNSTAPDTVIPGATYELVAQGPDLPVGAPSAPGSAVVPSGDEFWAQATTDAAGQLSFPVPAGYSWCLHETLVPAGYLLDGSFHCTAVLTDVSTPAAANVALAETPAPTQLPYTGAPSGWVLFAAGLLLTTGSAMCWLATARRRRAP